MQVNVFSGFMIFQMFDVADPFPEANINNIRECCAEFIVELLEDFNAALAEIKEDGTLDKIISQLNNDDKNILLTVNPKSYSKLVGQNKSNINKLQNMGFSVEIQRDSNLNKYDVIVKKQG